jgi:hypothetical protein
MAVGSFSKQSGKSIRPEWGFETEKRSGAGRRSLRGGPHGLACRRPGVVGYLMSFQ